MYEECILYGGSACGSKRRLSTMKSSSIATTTTTMSTQRERERERGARKTDTPIYNALKPAMRVICVRFTNTVRIHTHPSRQLAQISIRSIRVNYHMEARIQISEVTQGAILRVCFKFLDT